MNISLSRPHNFTYFLGEPLQLILPRDRPSYKTTLQLEIIYCIISLFVDVHKPYEYEEKKRKIIISRKYVVSKILTSA